MRRNLSFLMEHQASNKPVIFEITCENKSLQYFINMKADWLNRIHKNLEWKSYIEKIEGGFLWVIKNLKEFQFISTQGPVGLKDHLEEHDKEQKRKLYAKIRKEIPPEGVVYHIKCVNHPAELFEGGYRTVLQQMDKEIQITHISGKQFDVLFPTPKAYFKYLDFLWGLFDTILSR